MSHERRAREARPTLVALIWEASEGEDDQTLIRRVGAEVHENRKWPHSLRAVAAPRARARRARAERRAKGRPMHKDDLGLLDPSGDSHGYLVQAGGSLEL